ncbi:MAG: sigma-54 dependent transcriptional regulator [Leptospiraceae bacterium]|jgi:transcriptional regulator with PAS, ATPase and Fis domain|nr:sigma-54 dependent transcriptional regulator [Leptospiraceae bacterium]
MLPMVSLEKKLEILHKNIFKIGHAYEDFLLFLYNCNELLNNVFSFESSFFVLTEFTENPLTFGHVPKWFTNPIKKIFFSKIKIHPDDVEPLKQFFLNFDKSNSHPLQQQFKTMTKILQRLKQENYQLFYPIIFQNEIFGFYFAKTKKPLKEHDIYILDILSIYFALAIRNAIIRKENQKLRIQNKLTMEVENSYSIPENLKPMIIKIQDKSYLIASSQMKNMVENIEKLKNIYFPILITGETGTGKEFIARYFHYVNKADRPFIAINCSSIPESLWESELFGYKKGSFTDAKNDKKGLLEEAEDGSIFFDEIAEIPLEIQAKLLRLIQEKKFRPLGSTKEIEVKCNFIFATNKNLIDKIQKNEFREDLYYRISTIHFHLPPLRERKEDLLILIDYFINKYTELFNKKITLDKEVYQYLINPKIHPWKGNIRELENYIVKMIFEAKNSHITLESLVESKIHSSTQNDFIKEIEQTTEELLGLASGMQIDFENMIKKISKKIITEALERCKGNRTRASQLLGISRGKLNYQIKELNIKVESKD